MEIIKTKGGARIFLVKEDKFLTAGIALLINRPLKREEVTANALLVNLLGLGCEKYKGLSELNKAAAGLFGGCFDCVNLKKGNRQILEFYAETADEGDNVKNAVNFLGELIFKPLKEGKGFKKEYVEREKQALKDEIQAAKDNKKSYAKNRLTEEMFRGEGFGIYGDGYIEDLEKITAEGLYSHYEKILRNSAVDVIAVGSFDRDGITEALEGLSLKGREFKPEKPSEPKKREPSYITEKMKVSQGKLCVGIRTKGDYYSLLTANEIFGGGANSRLFMKARERESLCYYISSELVRCNNTVIVQSGISSENLRRVTEIVSEEIKDFENISEKEIKSAKVSLVKKYTAVEDSLSGRENFCLDTALYGGAKTPGEAAEKIKAVRDDEVRAAFSQAYTDTVYFLREGDRGE